LLIEPALIVYEGYNAFWCGVWEAKICDEEGGSKLCVNDTTSFLKPEPCFRGLWVSIKLKFVMAELLDEAIAKSAKTKIGKSLALPWTRLFVRPNLESDTC